MREVMRERFRWRVWRCFGWAEPLERYCNQTLGMMYSCGGETNDCGSVGGAGMFRSFLCEYLYEQKLLCGWIGGLFIENVEGDINEGG